MIAGLSLSGQDENPKDWMVGIIAPLPNTIETFYERELSGRSGNITSTHARSFPIGATVAYKGITFGFYATNVTISKYSSWWNMVSGDYSIDRLPNLDFWQRSYSLGYHYTFGKAYDLPLKPVFGTHVIIHETEQPGITPFDFTFDFGVRYKSVALLASVFNRRVALDHQKVTFPVINVGDIQSIWSIKAQYFF